MITADKEKHDLQEFEQRYGVNLSELLFSKRDRAEHEQMRRADAGGVRLL